MDKAQVDIIIPVLNQAELTRNCLKNIERNSDIPYRLILIDNGSDDETRELLDEYKSVHPGTILIRNMQNLGWVKAVNEGMKASACPYICIMNNDTIVRTKGWLSGLIGICGMAGDIGLVNPRFETKKKAVSRSLFIEIDFCRGYCVLIKREVMEKIGMLDEAYGMGYYDDDDYSVRAIRAGYRCVRANGVIVEHLRDTTFSALYEKEARMALHENNKKLFFSKWGLRLKVLFIITKGEDDAALSNLLFSLARRQHIISLWNARKPLRPGHINIRERIFPKILWRLFILLALKIGTSINKRTKYNLIFTDDSELSSKISGMRVSVYYVDPEKDADRITGIIESTARA